MNLMKNNMNEIKCPVCGIQFQEVGMANHIKGRAKNELWKICIGEKTTRKHLDYVIENTEKVKIKIFKLNIK
jgi:hypothetical protein